MKKQILALLTFLLVCGAVFAWTTLPGIQAFTYYTATFVVAPEGAGSVSPSSSKILAGTKTPNITATANAGYSFEGWYIDGTLVSTENPSQFTLNSDVTITAQFKQEAANTILGFIKPGCEGMGSVSVSPEGTPVEGGYKFNHGTAVTLKATAATGHQFDRWEDVNGATLSTSATYQFTLTEDCTIYAVFSKLENYNPDLIAFPGAEGYGRLTTGGRMVDSRGSKVYYVTRTDDTGEEGTLRWAVTTGDDTPRTVLFKVAGTIYLTSRLSCKGNITIAGQTAPGGGICLAGYQMKLTSNSIVRHIRFRAGDLPNKSMSQLDVENVTNVILDHCSFSWSMEENFTMYDNKYTTVQWCISSEGLYNSRNSKGSRSYATQWGGEYSTMHHCLLAHNNSRSPRFNGVRTENHDRKVDSEFFNNVIYNWGKKNSLYGGENYINAEGKDPEGAAPHYDRVYMIGNYFRPGPATQGATNNARYFVCPSGDINHVGQWYLKDNKFELSSKWRGSGNAWNDTELTKVNEDNYYGLSTNNSSRGMDFDTNSAAMLEKALMYELPAEYNPSGVNIESADAAYQNVVTQAGASLPRYDEIDKRVLAEAAGTQDPQFGGERGAKLGIIDSPSDITLQSHDDFAALYEGDNAADNREIDVTCYPRLQMDSDDCAVVDTDGDGLPDAYETSVGLNPNDASDGMKLTTSGYSNLEVFLNGVADGQIDAKLYTKHQPATPQAISLTFTVAQDGSGLYNSIQEAVDGVPEGSSALITIKAGVYDEHVLINKPNIHLMGQSKQNTIITGSKLHNEDGGNVDTNATVNVTANNVSFDNLTIRNTRYNEGQALALYTKGDRIVITNCNLEGYQDTYRTGKRGQRHLVRNTKIAGRTDFIYGDGEVYFDSDTLHIVESGGYIVAPDHQSPAYGYVFRDAVITAKSSGTTTYLGRPWHNTPKVSFINTRLTADVAIHPQGWHDMDGLPLQMAEYNTVDAQGNAVDLSQRKTSFTNTEGTTRSSKALLTPVETNSYKLSYMLSGNDQWDADWQAFILPAPQIQASSVQVSWNDPTGFAVCYLVTMSDGETFLTTQTWCDPQGRKCSVQAISAYGVLGEPAWSDQPSAISTSKADIPVVRREYFTPDGRQVTRLQHGLTIVREVLSDGTSRTTKVVAK